ncbi:hypothetical protein ACFFRL_13540 [Agromyces hippuratus]
MKPSAGVAGAIPRPRRPVQVVCVAGSQPRPLRPLRSCASPGANLDHSDL